MSQTKEAGVGNIGTEELSRFTMGRHSLGDVEGALKVLFGDSISKMKKADLDKVRRLFTMAATNVTQAPNLTKESKAKHVSDFFEKLSEAQFTDAQRRYPELLKVSSVTTPSSTTSSTPNPSLKPASPDRAKRTIPHQSMMAGGSA